MKERLKKYPNLIKDISNAPKIKLKKNDYLFKVFSVGERGTDLKPKLIQEVLSGLLKEICKHKCTFDYIVTVEPGGNPWGLLVAQALKIPLKIIRETQGYAEELKIKQKSVLYERNLCFSGFKKGKKVIIIDDIVSTGGTLKIIINTLKNLGVKIVGVFTILSKGDDYNKIEKSEEIKIHALVSLNKQGDLVF